MIEALKDFPDNVIAIACHGHVTKADYETVLIPDIEDKLSRHKKVRIYCEIAPDYGGLDPGAVWEDTKVGFGHLRDWERAAMVTDVEWMRHAAKFFGGFFGFLVSGSGVCSRPLTPTKHASGLLAGVPPRGCSVSCLRARRPAQRSTRRAVAALVWAYRFPKEACWNVRLTAA